MENTLISGDVVIVNKLYYGPRMPRSLYEVPWLNVFFKFKGKSVLKVETNQWKYRRLNGESAIKCHDVIAFNFPDNKKELYVKRCIGLPGDTFEIIKGQIYINNRLQSFPLSSKMLYQIKFNNKNAFLSFSDSLDIMGKDKISSQDNFMIMNLTSVQVNRFEASSCIDTISPILNYTGFQLQSYPWNNHFQWSCDFFGPLVIPSKGMTITLDDKKYILYKKVFENYEKQSIIMKDGKFFLNKNVIEQYTFKQDYYFMIGDNRHDSNDSRIWGFVPEEYIYGKVTFILYSYDSNNIAGTRFRWNRFLKQIK